MKQNVHNVERVIRIIIGLAILSLVFAPFFVQYGGILLG